jgi:hypothetical protein
MPRLSDRKRWCGRPDSNRHSDFSPRDFLTSYGFRRLAWARSRFRLVCGLDYTFTIARSRFRCCPSSLYTFAPVIRPERLARDCLLPVSPNLSSSAPSVSRRALNCLSPLRLPFRHARTCRQFSRQRTVRQRKTQARAFRLLLLGLPGNGGVRFGRCRRSAPPRDRRTLMIEASTVFLMWDA